MPVDRSHQNGMRRVVVTGGPGAGKTTLLAELAARGYSTVAESARTIIATRLAQGLAPRPDPASFAREILQMDIAKHAQPPRKAGLVFYDRGAVEALGMALEVGVLSQEEINANLAALVFHRTAFILPPWKAIYVNDAERDQSFDHAVVVHEQLARWYGQCGYQLNEVPRLSVACRADHVLDVLANDAWNDAPVRV